MHERCSHETLDDCNASVLQLVVAQCRSSDLVEGPLGYAVDCHVVLFLMGVGKRVLDLMMNRLIDIHFDAAGLTEYGLPNMGYPIPVENLNDSSGITGAFPFALMLFGLQERARDRDSGWRTLEPAMQRLAELLASQEDSFVNRDESMENTAEADQGHAFEGDQWWFELGPVDLRAQLVTIERQGTLLASVGPREDGRLRISVHRPLTGDSIKNLFRLCVKPHPEYGVSMRENNWEYALDASHGLGNVYTADAGGTYLSHYQSWEKCSGRTAENPPWRSDGEMGCRNADWVAVEIAVHLTYSRSQDT